MRTSRPRFWASSCLGFLAPVINAFHAAMEVEGPNDFSLGDVACMTVDDSKEAFKGFTLAQRAKLNNALRKAQNKVAPKVKTPTTSSTRTGRPSLCYRTNCGKR